MRKLLLICLLGLVGCDCEKKNPVVSYSYQYKAVVNGVNVTCKYSYTHNCGVRLVACEDGNEYECVSNVTRIKVQR